MKLKDKTIVFLGATRFDDEFESTSLTTAKYLAIENTVIYVDYPYTWKDYFSDKATSRLLLRKKGFKTVENALLSTPWSRRMEVLILPLLLSINFLPEGRLYRYLLKINEKRIAERINRVINDCDQSEVVFINSFNFHYPNLGNYIKTTLCVYQCVDPLIGSHDTKHGIISEEILVKQADLVVCTSKQLFKEKKRLNGNTFFIPNAADLALSNQALENRLEIHPLLNDIPKPIIGYFGVIERRMDFSMLTDVIESNKDKSFVFVGPFGEEFVPKGFQSIQNVYFTGRVPYQEMPSVLKGFDISIIPFKKDEVSSTIFPLKLFEYLGAGKPVIATDFNDDLEEFTKGTVKYCKGAKEFSEAIEFYLLNDSTDLKNNRLAIASENTWDKRLSELSSLVNEFYQIALLKSSNQNNI